MRRPTLSLRIGFTALLALLVLPIGTGGFAAAGSEAPASDAQAAAAAQPSSTRAVRVDARKLIRDVETLSRPDLEGRLTGSKGNRKAQAIILDRFKALNLQPVNGSFEQRFPFTSTRDRTAREVPDAANLVGVIPGSSERDIFVLVTAHYDHLGVRNGQTYHGADDNASGVAALLAIAEWFGRNHPRKSLAFVAFDAEEQGLQGSKHFVAHPPIDLKRVSVVVNLDMLGRGDRNVLFVAGAHHSPALKAPVSEASEGRGITVAFGHDRPGIKGMDDWTQLSDHGPFHAAGIPFLYFGVEDHPDYHKPTDTADKIPAAFYVEATEVVLDTVRRLLDMKPAPRAARAP